MKRLGIAGGLTGLSGLSAIVGSGLDWYVDSVNGSDANTGRSANQAFQTIFDGYENRRY